MIKSIDCFRDENGIALPAPFFMADGGMPEKNVFLQFVRTKTNMRKRFNVTGSCNPEWHYMVDNAKRFKAVEDLIDMGAYFTINRARQYGKTTMLQMIWRRLSDRYLIIDCSFEGVDDNAFSSHAAFAKMFARQMVNRLEPRRIEEGLVNIWKNCTAKDLDELSETITRFTKMSPKPVVLTIDEVDKSSDNQLFLNFLGMLRNKYLQRSVEGLNSTFHSVILAGVYDVKNLKLKLRPDAEKKYNSPWNIATDFNVDMTFHPEEIAQMLRDYENDRHTGMDIKAISEEIYKYTSGYPFLVSKLCKVIDEELGRNWTLDGVQEAAKTTIFNKNTLFTSMTRNLEEYPELKRFIYSLSILGDNITYDPNNPVIDFATMFGIIKYDANRKVSIHNIIFEEVLNNYFIAEQNIADMGKLRINYNYVTDGRLNMEFVLQRFHDLMREEYREEDGKFIERQGRLIFLSFLKPIINGTGFYYVEPQTRDNRRMDLIVTYGREEFVVELKIWRGDKYEQKGRDQLSEYLATRGKDEGYLVTFDFSKNKEEKEPEWIECNGKRIFEAVI